MPKFQVTVATVYEFEAEDKHDARLTVEEGEMPRNHVVVDAYVTDVEEVED